MDNRNDLKYIKEFNLSKSPLRADLIIIRKNSSAEIINQIGKIFGKYNAIEYKSPSDTLTFDDYIKTISYAGLFVTGGNYPEKVQIEDMTVSMFSEKYPREMIKRLINTGCSVEEKYPGIYYVSGFIKIPTQIVVIRELEKSEHMTLRVLTKQADEDDVIDFIALVNKFKGREEIDKAESVLQASITANLLLYDKVRGRIEVCEALRNLMKDEIDRDIAAGEARGEARGEVRGELRGKTNALLESVRSLTETLKLTSEQAMDALKISPEDRARLSEQL